MREVQTTAGPIDAGELGRTLIHEHFRGRDEAVAHQWPHVHDEKAAWDACMQQAGLVKPHVVATTVEPTAMLLGRELSLLQRVAAETGLDRYGYGIFLPTEKRNATTLELLQRGHVERMLLSQDFVAAFDWFPPEFMEQAVAGGLIDEGFSMALLFEKVLPTLKDGGM